MGKFLPILLGIAGLGVGVGAGIALKPPPDLVEINPSSEIGMPDALDASDMHGEGEDVAESEHSSESDFVKMNNQFVIPVVAGSRVGALVVVSLSLEIEAGGSEPFYQREPKLRDAFLQVLFDHANSGGFDGVFTDGSKLQNLRRALLEIAIKVMGTAVLDVLVTDIVRQDI